MSENTSARGRRSRRERRSIPTVPEQRPFAQPRLRRPPTALASDDEIEMIHRAALRILDELGMKVLDAETRSILAGAGASVDGEMVRFDPALVEELRATAPASFTFHARNPAHDLVMGDDYLTFSAVNSAPNVADLDDGRRTGNRHDFRNLLRLAQSLNSIHFTPGYPVEPVDLHPSIRHLDATDDLFTLTDKAIHVYSLGRDRVLDALEMTRIACGLTDAELDQRPSLCTIINTNSPLTLDVPMSIGTIELARRNQVVCVTPFTLAGAMAPITIAGALSQQHAEALVGLMLTQVVRPGAPVVYGSFTSNVDMQSGAPAFGTPEYWRATVISGQLARHVGVPFRSSNACAANAVDSQAAYESMFSLWGAVDAGTNWLQHAAGWMEGGLHASFEKMVIDADLLHMVSATLDPVIVDDDTLGFDTIAQVGPGGHFFGTDHTQARYRTEHHRPMVSDWRNYESWFEAGAPHAAEHANRLMKAFLAEYEPPPMDDTIRAELDDFVGRRKAEGGVATDF